WGKGLWPEHFLAVCLGLRRPIRAGTGAKQLGLFLGLSGCGQATQGAAGPCSAGAGIKDNEGYRNRFGQLRPWVEGQGARGKGKGGWVRRWSDGISWSWLLVLVLGSGIFVGRIVIQQQGAWTGPPGTE